MTRDTFELPSPSQIAERLVTPTPGDRAESPELEWEDHYPWPTLRPEAMYGLAGELVDALGVQTEADAAGILATVLVSFGNACGPGPHAVVLDDHHPPRFFVVLVGATSSGGKGMADASVRPFFRAADPEWLRNCRKGGFGSGESIIADLSGYNQEIETVEKRALVFEPEFGRLLTVNGREGSTSSPILRAAYDDGHLEIRRAKGKLVADGAHVSLLAHITPEELRAKLCSLEIASGFANRCFFILVKRARKIPSGGRLDPSVFGRFGRKVAEALNFARGVGTMRRDLEAENLWADLYHAEPDREGLVGAVCGRWQAQKLRLSVTYALLDKSDTIRAEHVAAAQAMWEYNVESAQRIWGDHSGNDNEHRLLIRLRDVYPEGLDRTAQRDLFSRRAGEGKTNAWRESLMRRGLARESSELTGGRARHILFALPRDQSKKSDQSTAVAADREQQGILL